MTLPESAIQALDPIFNAMYLTRINTYSQSDRSLNIICHSNAHWDALLASALAVLGYDIFLKMDDEVKMSTACRRDIDVLKLLQITYIWG